MGAETGKSKPKQVVENIEDRIGQTFPWLKTSLGSLWTIFWIIIAFTVEAIFFLIPIILIALGILFLIFVIAQGGDLPIIDSFWWGRDKKKEENVTRKMNYMPDNDNS